MAPLMAAYINPTFPGLVPKAKINAGGAVGLKSQSLIYLSGSEFQRESEA